MVEAHTESGTESELVCTDGTGFSTFVTNIVYVNKIRIFERPSHEHLCLLFICNIEVVSLSDIHEKAAA